MQLPTAPYRSFASDNASGAHPAVLDAVAAANDGHALAYGDDRWTRECESLFRELFGRGESYLAFNGTGANVFGLLALLRPAEAVVCAAGAHIDVDETGAAERILGAKLIPLATPRTGPAAGKLVPEQLADLAWMFGSEHHAQPAVVSITQSTELGTVYTPDEVAALCDAAHAIGMRVHMDGARIANATAALGASRRVLRACTVDAGVDVITFGGTKNGLLGGEAVVFLDEALAARARYLRKSGQPAALQDALRRRPVHRPARRRPVAAQRRPRQRDGRPAVRRGARPARRRRRSAGGQQPVPGAAAAGHRRRSRRGASSGSGIPPAPRCAG